MSEERAHHVPVIPLLVFAAVDIALALVILIDGGFSIQFWLVAAIGLGLAFFALRALLLRRMMGPNEPS
jgi:hypothetical protein